MDILYVSQTILAITTTLVLLVVLALASATLYFTVSLAMVIRKSAEKVSHDIEEMKNHWKKVAIIVPLVKVAMNWWGRKSNKE